MLERERVGRAVALEDEATQPEQRRAVVTSWVDTGLEVPEHRQRNHGSELREETPREFLADELRQHRRQAFRSLEDRVADEAVAHHDVRRSLEDVVALDIAVKVQQTVLGRAPQKIA